MSLIAALPVLSAPHPSHPWSVFVRDREMLENQAAQWEIPTMTVVADSKKRVTIRHAKPGDRFDVQSAGDGKFVLTKLKPVRQARPARVRIEKRGRYSVGVLGRPISQEAIKEALSEFP